MADIVRMIRHAAPPPEKQGRFWGLADPGTDPAGLQAVRAAAATIEADTEYLLCSPIDRARRTAKEITRHTGLPVVVDPALAEMDFGKLDGMTWDEFDAAFPGEADKWTAQGNAYTPPGGENVDAFFGRVRDAWVRITALPDRTVCVVSHAGVLAAWNCFFAGLPLDQWTRHIPDYACPQAWIRTDNGWSRL